MPGRPRSAARPSAASRPGRRTRLRTALFAVALAAGLHLGGGTASALEIPEPTYVAPKGPAPISCPFVFVYFTQIQSYPQSGYQPCLRGPGTPLYHSTDTPITYGDFGSAIQVTMPATIEGTRAKGRLVVQTPSREPRQAFSGVDLYVPGQKWTEPWSARRFAALNYKQTGFDYVFENYRVVDPSGWALQFQAEHSVVVDMDLDKSLFDRDRYFFFQTSVDGGPNAANGGVVPRDVWIKVPKLIKGVPTPKCRAVQTGPGEYRLTSLSTDPSGLDPLATWTFPDGSTLTGKDVTKRFTQPGDFAVKLEVQGPEEKASTTCTTIRVPWPTLALGIDYPSGKPPFKKDTPVPVRVTVKAVGDTGIGQVENIRFVAANATHGGLLKATGSGVTFGTSPTVSPAIPGSGFTLLPGQSKVFTTSLVPTGVGRYSLTSQVTGTSPARSAGGATVNYAVGKTATNAGEVGDALQVSIELSPESGTQQTELSTEEAPEPVTVTAKITLKNNAAQKLTSLVLDEVKATSTSKTAAGQDGLAVTRIGGEAIPPEGLPIELPAGGLGSGNSITRTYTFKAADDGDVEFSAIAHGTREGGIQDVGSAHEDWSLKPKYLLQVKTQLVLPKTVSTPLPAGESARIKGTIKNLSGSDELEVGPMYPELSGNAGVMSLTWDATGSDPDEMLTPNEGSIRLGPREEKTFTVRFTTGYSDPTQLEGEHKSGGTRANVKFTPWAKATDEDGVTRDVKASELKAQAGQLDFHLTIDDSITIPELEPFAFAGAILYGGAQGAKNAAASVALAPADLLIFSYTSLRAIADYQTTMWNGFTEAEKDLFQKDVTALAVEILKRNAEAAAMAPSELFAKVYTAVGDKMDAQAKAWEVGDWTTVVEEYSAVGADAIGQVILPIAYAKMAKSTGAVAAIQRAQRKLQAVFESTVGFKLASIQKIEELAPLLEDIKNGVELAPEQLDVLYGITPEELSELQRLATKHNFLLTVRSRHASSIEWIKKGAQMKPEAIKIKTVSSLDSKLGYSADDIGQLVFRKPTPLAEFEAATGAGAKNLDGYVDAYLDRLQGNGTLKNAVERLEAEERIALRIKEWKKYELEYKRASKLGHDTNAGHGYLDVSFNWKGNAVSDATRKGTGKYVGFRLRKIPGDTESYVMEMMNHRTGRWASITGDIDPIAFTLLDGAPLSEAQHADLLDDMRTSELLKSQHPESATFVGVRPKEHSPDQWKHDGVAFVQSQFKVGEAALQIAPGGVAPRAVRLNASKSEWNSAFDYHLYWDGGFTYSGSHVPRGAQPIPTTDWAAIQAAEYVQAKAAGRQTLVPSSAAGGEPTFGSCKVSFATTPAADPLVLTPSGDLGRVKKATTAGGAPSLERADDITTTCFGDGETPPKPSELIVSPMTQVIGGSKPGDTEVKVDETEGAAPKHSPVGLEVGQEVVIGAGTDHPEQRTVTGFNSIIVDRPLAFAHAEGEAIVVVTAAPQAPGGGGGPTDGAGPLLTPTPPPGGGTKPGGSTPGGSTPLAGGLRPAIAKGRNKGPTIKGSPRRGQTLQCRAGTWTGTAPIALGYAWERRSGKKWVAIRKQSKAKYKVTTSDRGRQLRCTVAARNGLGTASASTKAVTVAKR